MAKTRRLFIFAAYDPAGGIIDDSGLLYVRALSKFGDVVFYMDNDATESELQKIRKIPNVLYADAARHNEYDFGSYKRGFNWAKNNGILEKYTIIYFVNDSVYGPLGSMRSVLEKLESANTDAVAICDTSRRFKKQRFIESWFWGVSARVFFLDDFQQFMASVKKQPSKEMVTAIYERGITELLLRNNFTYAAAFTTGNRGIYNHIKRLYRRGMPFFKKAAFPRHSGALGGQIDYILRRTEPAMRGAILENAGRVFGTKYVAWLLTRNPFKIAIRKIKYKLTKVF